MIRAELQDVDGNVVTVNFRARSPLARLSGECAHHNVTLDHELTCIECDDCGAKLNPISWIENRIKVFEWIERRARYANARIKLAEMRTRTKCEHCGQMTPVRIPEGQIRAVMAEQGAGNG